MTKTFSIASSLLNAIAVLFMVLGVSAIPYEAWGDEYTLSIGCMVSDCNWSVTDPEDCKAVNKNDCEGPSCGCRIGDIPGQEGEETCYCQN